MSLALQLYEKEYHQLKLTYNAYLESSHVIGLVQLISYENDNNEFSVWSV